MPNVPEPAAFKRPRRWRRALLTGLAVPPLLLGMLGLSAAYHIYANNRTLAEDRHFPAQAAPLAAQKLLVFAPHCDDETLGAAGLMRQARHAGADVHVVIFSNGDGFRVGVEREYKELRVAPADYVRYAYHRQGESRAALKVLGVAADHITFLGYPDRGLMPMWTTNWSAQKPFLSTFTRTDHSPYANSPTPHAAYAGETALADVERQMQADQPTDIYITHPGDDHPDHAAASVFVQTALADLKAKGQPWAQTARLHFYLVHRGDWPCPQGLHEEASLPPPAPMAALDTQWEELPLSVRDVHAKYAAIKRYRSQTELTGRFLFSFARRNELFGTLPDARANALPRVSDNRMVLNGSAAPWAGMLPVALDPAGDTVLRAFQASGDITRLFACRDSRFLYLRMDARQRLTPRVSYKFSLRPLSGAGVPSPFLTVAVSPGSEGKAQAVSGSAGASSVWHGSLLEVRLPLAQAGLNAARSGETLYLAAETRFAGIAVDRTGYRAVDCPALLSRAASR